MLVRLTEKLSFLTSEMKYRPSEQWDEVFKENSHYVDTECYGNDCIGESCIEEARDCSQLAFSVSKL